MGINWLRSDLSDRSQFGHVVGRASSCSRLSREFHNFGLALIILIFSVLDQMEVIMFRSSTPQEQIS